MRNEEQLTAEVFTITNMAIAVIFKQLLLCTFKEMSIKYLLPSTFIRGFHHRIPYLSTCLCISVKNLLLEMVLSSYDSSPESLLRWLNVLFLCQLSPQCSSPSKNIKNQCIILIKNINTKLKNINIREIAISTGLCECNYSGIIY